MTISIRHIPRQTKAGHFSIAGHTFYWSYETIIGYMAPSGEKWRRDNVWGPTTGRHIKEHGLSDATVCDSETAFLAVINQNLAIAHIDHA